MTKRIFVMSILLALTFSLTGVAIADDTAAEPAPAASPAAPKKFAAKSHRDKKAAAPSEKTLKDGLKYVDTVVGTGAEAAAGHEVVVNYTGKLTNGKVFDSSVDRSPFSFMLGAGRVIKGWDEGVPGMKVGGKRTLTIPSKLGYGERGAGETIPPNSTLIFDVELLEVK